MNGKDGSGQGGAMAFLVLTAVFWSFGGVLIKWVQWHPMAISGMRSAIGALTIWILFRDMHFNWSRAQIGGAVAFRRHGDAVRRRHQGDHGGERDPSPVHRSRLCRPFRPVVPRGASRREDVISIAVILGGMSLFFLDKLTPAGMWGNIAALASGACFGWLTLFLRAQKGGSGIESIFLGNLLAAAAGIPFMFGSMPDARSWAGLLLLGTVQMGIPYVLFAMAIRHVPAVTAILIPMIEPVLNPVWVLLFLGETPGPMAILGGSIILGVVALRCIR